jgi:hypothetical protein
LISADASRREIQTLAETNQYLRLDIGGSSFLLPGTVRYTIEQRDSLTPNPESGRPVVAYRLIRSSRWPAYCVDADLRPAPRSDWQRAVFIETASEAVGLIVDDAHLLPRGGVQVAPFTPLGAPPTPRGHLFAAAWISGRRVTLVLDPPALIDYLRGLGE